MTKTLDPVEDLRRAVMACMLWEDGFKESGQDVRSRVKALVPKVQPFQVAAIAIEARERQHLRKVPLLLVRELARRAGDAPDGLVAKTLSRVIQRADELPAFLELYWAEGRRPLSAQVKKGLAWAFTKFDEYALAKYNRDHKIKLRDVLFMVHAKPKDEQQAALWQRLVKGELAPAGTWEERLSAGEDKREVFESLLKDKKLGYLALLRNLRNMEAAQVNRSLIAQALVNVAAKAKALPFRFVAAAQAAPNFTQELDAAMQLSLAGLPKLPGSTAMVVDVSASMDYKLSDKSDLNRRDAAAALAVLVQGVCEDVRVFSFSEDLVEVVGGKGMALTTAISKSQRHGGTNLGKSLKTLNTMMRADRTIVITDEQSHDAVGAPQGRGYILNVSTNERGVGYGEWTHINGFSESVVDWISQYEQVAELAIA